MTILQKMLFVPVLSLFLYASFFLYSYSEQQKNSNKINEFREQHLPIVGVVHENVQLFEKISTLFKDAALAQESIWLQETASLKAHLQRNFLTLAESPNILNPQLVEQAERHFLLYFDKAEELAQKLIVNEQTLISEVELVEQVERHYTDSLAQLKRIESEAELMFFQTLNDTNKLMQQLLFISSIITVALILFLLITTFAVSLTTYFSVRQVIIRMKELASGSVDFSRRMERDRRDELGSLIFWFNKLSDKIEQDYITLQTISITDKLTQLNNRTRTDEYLPQAITKARSENTDLAVALLDIDHFKRVNDTFGHQIGDTVLQTVANILKECAAEHDFVGRWGGEEFILVIPNVAQVKIVEYLDHIRTRVSDTSFSEVGQVTVSIGVALLQQQSTPKTLLSQADKALYLAKDSGRNKVILATDEIGH